MPTLSDISLYFFILFLCSCSVIFYVKIILTPFDMHVLFPTTLLSSWSIKIYEPIIFIQLSVNFHLQTLWNVTTALSNTYQHLSRVYSTTCYLTARFMEKAVHREARVGEAWLWRHSMAVHVNFLEANSVKMWADETTCTREEMVF